MELTPEFVKEAGLSEEQVGKVKAYGETHVATIKKEWDGKANTDAEAIIGGAVKYAQDKTGVKVERNQGEKFGDYLSRIAETAISTKQADVDRLKGEYETKLKDFKGDTATKAELEQAKAALDAAKQKLADYDSLKEKADKYEPAVQELSTLKLEVAFGNVKPSFPDTVNAYEAAAKWGDFKKDVLSKYTIELVEGVPTCIDKENQYKVVKLSDLVAKDENIQALVKGRQQAGPGGKPVTGKKIEGVPFEVPEGATSADRAKLIREYLAKENIGPTHPQYAAKFAEINKKILAG